MKLTFDLWDVRDMTLCVRLYSVPLRGELTVTLNSIHKFHALVSDWSFSRNPLVHISSSMQVYSFFRLLRFYWILFSADQLSHTCTVGASSSNSLHDPNFIKVTNSKFCPSLTVQRLFGHINPKENLVFHRCFGIPRILISSMHFDYCLFFCVISILKKHCLQPSYVIWVKSAKLCSFVSWVGVIYIEQRWNKVGKQR